MPKETITAEKTIVLLLKNERGEPVGAVIRNGHWVFYKVDLMSDDDILDMLKKPEAPDTIQRQRNV